MDERSVAVTLRFSPRPPERFRWAVWRLLVYCEFRPFTKMKYPVPMVKSMKNMSTVATVLASPFLERVLLLFIVLIFSYVCWKVRKYVLR